MGRPYRIVSIDGGGIRGLVPAVALERLAATPGLRRFLERTHLFAGTSTGGLLALGLAQGLSPAALRALYLDDGPAIFADRFLDDVRDLGKLVGADHDLGPLRRVVRRVFGDRTLGDLPKRVLIPTFDLDDGHDDPAARRWKPKLFHNFPGGDDGDLGEPVWKVALRTAAAPTYFPSYEGYVDGGVYANNPAMCALAQTRDPRCAGRRPALDDVRLLSLSTGTVLEHVAGARHDWGYAQWARPLLALMLDGVAGIADYQCRQLLGDAGYHRLDPVFPPNRKVPLDAAGPEDLAFLEAFARGVDLGATAAWLAARW